MSVTFSWARLKDSEAMEIESENLLSIRQYAGKDVNVPNNFPTVQHILTVICTGLGDTANVGYSQGGH